MRWPWQRVSSGDRLVASWSGQTLSYVRARPGAGSEAPTVLQVGVEQQGSDTMEAFVARLAGLGLKGCDASIMLRPEQYQVLQIPAPAVPQEELKAAARYQIREMVEAHIDDLTLDVMHVGDGQQKNNPQLFVVAATNAVVREVMALANALQWTVTVIDIQETSQRNLQTAWAARNGSADRADAALVVTDDRQAVMTISANGELYYTRRLELPDGFMAMAWGQHADVVEKPADVYTPVDEYVPDYSGGGAAYGSVVQPAGSEPAQRLVVEIQRSLDLWDRSWSALPLNGLRVYAAGRTDELANWLSLETGQAVTALDVDALIPGLQAFPVADRAICTPLLGLLLRTETR